MRFYLWVWLALGSTFVARAQGAMDVKFNCTPPDAQVTVLQGGSLQGSNLASDLVKLQVSGDLTVRFHHDGYDDLTVTIPRQDLGAVYPREGVVRLQARPGSVPVWIFGVFPLVAAAVLVGSLRARKGAVRGQVVGGCQIVEEIGRGGMATVYRAVDPKGRRVAVKLSDQSITEAAEDRKRFQREGDICSQLKHPHLIEQLAHGFEDGRGYLVLELLEGETLRERLGRVKRFSLAEAVALMAPVLDALAYAHRLGVVHRDLKPENLFCTRDGLKVVDFGVARGANFTVATATGIVMGTPTYMSPEQLDGHIDPASDQYALGIILYELLTGSPPFDDPDPMVIVEMQMGRTARPLRQVDPDLPASVEALVARMLEKNPKRRFPDLASAHQALLDCLS